LKTTQWKDELEFFINLHSAVETSYVDGGPLWKTRPQDSSIHLLSTLEMESKSEKEVQDILRHQHIYIHPSPSFKPSYGFDAEGMSTVAELDKSIILHGVYTFTPLLLSPTPYTVADYSKRNTYSTHSRHVRGTPQDLLDNEDAGENGCILNGLDFPMPGANNFPTSFASDVVAFNRTIDMPMCNRDVIYPSPSMKWALAANSNAYHAWHIDCDGFGTVIKVAAGMKWWLVAKPKLGSSFSGISLFMKNYDLSAINNDKWDIEAILLTPGSTL
jgi:hypothetical protein